MQVVLVGELSQGCLLGTAIDSRHTERVSGFRDRERIGSMTTNDDGKSPTNMY